MIKKLIPILLVVFLLSGCTTNNKLSCAPKQGTIPGLGSSQESSEPDTSSSLTSSNLQ